jgi:hypothetical protein
VETVAEDKRRPEQIVEVTVREGLREVLHRRQTDRKELSIQVLDANEQDSLRSDIPRIVIPEITNKVGGNSPAE